MRDTIAEQLLVHELKWDTATAAREFRKIRYLAAVKYDAYSNFDPGKRFMESLVLWLRQFVTVEEKKYAYEFVMNRIVYISESQMDHLVDLLYPHRILPILLQQAVYYFQI